LFLITTAYPILEKQSYCLEKLFKLYVLLKDADLIGCETIAIDGTKAEPTIARKPILKIDKHVDYIEVKTKNT
jgi:hypothetical protein